mmetsp:Transcript_32447/g.58058  ORF Transcript_32447/g.58058 Transcript_32447/m.58058 type:complete len:217 (-) Transcript_32447:34-684(-)
MAHLVVRHQTLRLSVHHRRPLHPRYDAVNRVVNLLQTDAVLVAAARQDGGLVQQVGEVGAGETGRAQRDGLQADIVQQLLVTGVHIQNLTAALLIRHVHANLAVKAPGTEERGVQNVRAVGRRDDNDTGVALKAVHLRQQLVQRLLALVVAAADAGATRAAHRINLVHKHNAGRVLLGLLEQVTDAGGAHAHEHLHKLRSRNGEERHTRLARNSLR